jgi:hypothetical protein
MAPSWKGNKLIAKRTAADLDGRRERRQTSGRIAGDHSSACINALSSGHDYARRGNGVGSTVEVHRLIGSHDDRGPGALSSQRTPPARAVQAGRRSGVPRPPILMSLAAAVGCFSALHPG